MSRKTRAKRENDRSVVREGRSATERPRGGGLEGEKGRNIRRGAKESISHRTAKKKEGWRDRAEREREREGEKD